MSWILIGNTRPDGIKNKESLENITISKKNKIYILSNGFFLSTLVWFFQMILCILQIQNYYKLDFLSHKEKTILNLTI